MSRTPVSDEKLKFYIDEFLSHVNKGLPVESGSDPSRFNCYLYECASKITSELNSSYHTLHEIQKIFAKLTRTETDRSLKLHPPFYTECGINIHLGRRVLINSGCTFQDQGGIFIGDDCQIGHNVTILTLNHGLEKDDRATLYPSKVVIGNNVWIGSGSIILPGVTISDNAVIGAGSVVTKKVEPDSKVAGNPARPI